MGWYDFYSYFYSCFCYNSSVWKSKVYYSTLCMYYTSSTTYFFIFCILFVNGRWILHKYCCCRCQCGCQCDCNRSYIHFRNYCLIILFQRKICWRRNNSNRLNTSTTPATTNTIATVITSTTMSHHHLHHVQVHVH